MESLCDVAPEKTEPSVQEGAALVNNADMTTPDYGHGGPLPNELSESLEPDSSRSRRSVASGTESLESHHHTCEEMRKSFEDAGSHISVSSLYRPSLYARVMVKFMLESGEELYEYFKATEDVSTVKEALSKIFQVPSYVLRLFVDGSVVEDNFTLEMLGFNADQIASAFLKSSRKEFPLSLTNLPPDYKRRHIRYVRVQIEMDEMKVVRVVVMDETMKKPFLGGYRAKESGIEYHHAYSQTPPFPPKPPRVLRERDSQTAWWRDAQQNTVCHRATQMFRRDHFIPCATDVIKTAQRYITAEEAEKARRLEEKVRVIQRYFRAWRMRVVFRKLAEEYRKCLENEVKREERLARERDERIKTDLVKRAFPRTRADFDMLYAAIEHWRQEQVRHIKASTRSEASRRALYCLVLDREVELLDKIERHRMEVKADKMRLKEMKQLDRCAEPVKWTGYKGLMVSMDTLRTQRARDLRDLYLAVCREPESVEDRADLLIKLKDQLFAYCVPLADEAAHLAMRECELLARRLSSEQLSGLRERLKLLLRQFLKCPEFNPEAAKYSLKYSRQGMEFTLFFCARCRKLMPKESFQPGNRDDRVQYCRSCHWLESIAMSRTDLSPYRFILRALRRDEKKRGCYSSVAFVMQEADFHYLVTNIWHGRSAISQKETIRDLRMCRWNIRKDWAPWNCILLTEEEARAHVRIKDFREVYEPGFAAEMHSKHLMARQRFKQLAATEQQFRESCAWEAVKDAAVYCPPSSEADAFQP